MNQHARPPLQFLVSSSCLLVFFIVVDHLRSAVIWLTLLLTTLLTWHSFLLGERNRLNLIQGVQNQDGGA